MESLKADFGKKLGPLPVWTWAVLALAVLLAWMWFGKWGFFGSKSAGSASGQAAGPGASAGGGPLGGGGGALPIGGNGSTATGNPWLGNAPTYGSTATPSVSYAGGGGGWNSTLAASASQIASQTASTGSFNPGQTTFGGVSGGPGGTSIINAVPAMSSTPTSIPSLNQFNPTSPYGRGN